ncbi:hypothetical protein GCM10011376_38870 [Nocardioides flavus (ex Wang et al. 2016)]|uniref:SnoaL-like domain-containing protein n=1 Tax=Nocardioides flavus (ex Wang et al. 2016) TaxID=2058780 RepID=A0ABQ3HS42_9ACTN|nr:hypothetical protein [Nocardioides flavus (ex Wang et al. 2016)]GHE19277.1 hypothetical protein GCM10011376_38870 [Nocardioides flavus (ex Wang et al. 2016)]
MDPRRLLPVLTAAACALVVATLVVGHGRPDEVGRAAAPRAQVSGAASAVSPSEPAAVLAEWDERRSAAWAKGDATALTALYVPRSRSGAADVRLLRAWAARGLRVEGLTTQLLGLRVVERSSRRLVLRVTDRVAGGVAVGGGAPVALPADRASTRRVVLVRQRGDWLVEEVRDQERAAARTSRTSSSSKS